MKNVQSWTLVLLMLFTHLDVFAASKPGVIVSPMQNSSSSAQAVSAISLALEKSGRVVLVPQKEIIGFIEQYAQDQKPTSSEEAFEFFTQGKNAYQNLDMENAADYFRKAQRLYQNVLWDEESFAAYRTTKFQLAQTYLALGRQEEAKLQMQEVMLLDPNRNEKKLSEKFYSPQVRRLYQDVFAQFQSMDRGTVLIESNPSGVMVSMDGKSFGTTPVTIPNVVVGKHYFHVKKEGFEEKLKEQFIVKGQNRININLAATGKSEVFKHFAVTEQGQDISTARSSFLDEIGVALGADLFVFLTPLSGKVQGQLFDQRSQERSPIVTAQSPEALVEDLLNYLGDDGYVTQAKARGIQTTQTEKQLTKDAQAPAVSTSAPAASKSEAGKNGITKQWWFWPAVGVVVIGAGAGLYFGGVFDSGGSGNSTLTTEIP